MERDDIRMIDALKDVDLREKTILKLLAKSLHDDLLHGDLGATNTMPSIPDNGEGSRPDPATEDVVSDDARVSHAAADHQLSHRGKT